MNIEFVAVGDFKTTRLRYTSIITKLNRVISKRLLNAKRNSLYKVIYNMPLCVLCIVIVVCIVFIFPLMF